MKIKEFSIENFSSYENKTDFILSNNFNIFIGPNGGGKSNALGSLETFFHSFLIRKYVTRTVGSNNEKRVESDPNFSQNSINNGKNKYFSIYDPKKPSRMHIKLQTDKRDADNIRLIIKHNQTLQKELLNTEINALSSVEEDVIKKIEGGTEIQFSCMNNTFLDYHKDPISSVFFRYLNLCPLLECSQHEEIKINFSRPLYFLGLNRDHSINMSFGITDPLDSFVNNFTNNPLSQFQTRINVLRQRCDAMARNAMMIADDIFLQSAEIQEYKKLLSIIGYDWNLKDIGYPNYRAEYTRDGKDIDPNKLSSGEASIFTILHSILGSNIRNGVFILDEPELHLHPRLQKILLNLLYRISEERNLQIIFSTHSPYFINPDTIGSVTRIYRKNHSSYIVRLNEQALPDKSMLLNMINSHNNEKIFFSDFVILVEGISDKLIFEKIFERIARERNIHESYEIVEVHGKQNFERYKKLLESIKMPFHIIADQDYLEDVGDQDIRSLFVSNDKKILEIMKDKKSRLVEELREALEKKDILSASNTFKKIQARGHTLQIKNRKDEEILEKNISDLHQRNIYVLKNGQLEDYLPDSVGSIDTIIELTGTKNWEEKLKNKDSLIEIVEKIINTQHG